MVLLYPHTLIKIHVIIDILENRLATKFHTVLLFKRKTEVCNGVPLSPLHLLPVTQSYYLLTCVSRFGQKAC